MCHSSDELAAFSRHPNPDRQFVEVRPLLPIDVVRVIDAECIAQSTADRPVDRTQMVRRILAQWAAERHRQASVIVTVAGSNPAFLDQEG
jgi:hypothetical protein